VPHIADLVAPDRLRPLRRVEYERMVDQGFFGDERVELVDGVIVEMSPQGTRHAGTIQRLTTKLVPLLLGKAEVRVQAPLAVSDVSLPEPDLAAVAPGDADSAHPTTAFLVIEVSESSLNKDRLVKANLYAAAAVPEYWIVDITAAIIEVHSDPVSGRYSRVTPARAGDTLHLRAFPDVAIAVADVLR
jgi:Uma2 family endonuclease